MKHLKKAALVAAILAAASQPFSAFALDGTFSGASDTQTGSVTVTNTVEGAKYKVYRLFTGSFMKNQPKDAPTEAVINVAEGLLNGTIAEASGAGNYMGNVAIENKKTYDLLVDAINRYPELLPAGTTYVDPLNNSYQSGAARGWTPSGNQHTQETQIADQFTKAPYNTVDFANYLAYRIAESDLAPLQTVTTTGKDDKAQININNLKAGYYIIISDENEGNGGYYEEGQEPSWEHDHQQMTSAIMLPVVGSVKVHAKSTTPEVTKEVRDNTSKEGEWDNAWGKTATAGVTFPKQGIEVELPTEGIGTEDSDNHDRQLEDWVKMTLKGLDYKVTGTVSHNMNDFDEYYYQFDDTMPIGLHTDNDNANSWNMKIMAHGISKDTGRAIDVDVTKEFTREIKDVEGAALPTSNITWTAANLKTVFDKAKIDYSYAHSDEILLTLTYTPVLNAESLKNMYDQVTVLSTPDVNKVKIHFSNDPYHNRDEKHGTTPTVITEVWDYSLDLQKLDDAVPQVALKGAEFTVTDEDGNYVGAPIVRDGGPDGGKFVWTGLNDNKIYTITETVVPDGYRAIEPIKFMITPEYRTDTISERRNSTTEKKTLVGLHITKFDDASNAIASNFFKSGTGDQVGELVASATIKSDIVNIKGPDMPLTGQAGIWTGVVAGGTIIAVSSYFALKKNKREEA